MASTQRAKSDNIKIIEAHVQEGSAITLDNQRRGEYLLQKLLGYGNFGMTFRAQSIQTKGTVAIKIQTAERAAYEAKIFKDIQLVEKCLQIVDFYEYGEILKVVNSRHQKNYPVVEYYQIQVDQKQMTPEVARAIAMFQAKDPQAWERLKAVGALKKQEKKLGCIVMEFVQGQPILEKYSSKCKIPQAVKLTQSICKAVEHMHRWHFVHGDLKPENIMVDKDGKIKVLDFSTAMREGDPNPIVAGSFYAPTHHQSRVKVTRYSDVYATTAILYRLLTGQDPVSQSYFSGTVRGTPVKGYVKKYFEALPQISGEVRKPMVTVLSSEIKAIANPVHSQVSLEQAITSKVNTLSILTPSPPTSVEGVFDYLPNNVSKLTDYKKQTISVDAKTLAQDLQSSLMIFYLWQVWFKVELLAQIALIIIVIFAAGLWVQDSFGLNILPESVSNSVASSRLSEK